MSTIPTLPDPATPAAAPVLATVPPAVAAQQTFIATVSAMLPTVPADAYDVVTTLIEQVINGERNFVPASTVPDLSQFTRNELVLARSKTTAVPDETRTRFQHLLQALCPSGTVPTPTEIDKLVSDAAAFERWRAFTVNELGITAPPTTATTLPPAPAPTTTMPVAPPTAATPAPVVTTTASPTPVLDVTAVDTDDDDDSPSGRSPFRGKLVTGLKAVAGFDPNPTTD